MELTWDLEVLYKGYEDPKYIEDSKKIIELINIAKEEKLDINNKVLSIEKHLEMELEISKLIRDPRLRFPVSISGLRDEELRNKTGIKTATFVHADGFIGAAETLEDAFLLANYALYN